MSKKITNPAWTAKSRANKELYDKHPEFYETLKLSGSSDLKCPTCTLPLFACDCEPIFTLVETKRGREVILTTKEFSHSVAYDRYMHKGRESALYLLKDKVKQTLAERKRDA